MANVVITTTAKTFTIDFGVTGSGNENPLTYSREAIKGIEHCDDPCATFMMRCNRDYRFSYDAQDNCLIVDSVAGAAPTNMPDLITKLTALMDY